MYNIASALIVREPAIGLIKWLRPKGLKVCSYVEKRAEVKNQTLKKIGWYSLPTLTLDCLFFANIFVIFVRFREVLRPWSCFLQEYKDNVNSFIQTV